MNLKLTFILIFISSFGYSQITNLKLKYNLDELFNETSGLIFFNSRIITHNDSGSMPKLYELDSLTGKLIRTIKIDNATNIDWEDITQDETHIYIGDTGNNLGNRKDLKIYKINKQDFLNNDNISPEIIEFSYKDQTDFSIKINNHNFDSEAISIVNNKIILFTKNWADLKTNIYEIPKKPGKYSISKEKSYNVNGLITASTYNVKNDYFLLTGYDKLLNPFLIYFKKDNFTKLNLTDLINQGSQIEAITFYSNDEYFITREEFNTKVNNIPITIPSSLFSFKFDSCKIPKNENCSNLDIENIYPNPVNNFLNIEFNKTIKKIIIYNINGKKLIMYSNPNKKINVSKLGNGMYFIKLHFSDNSMLIKKFIK